MQHIPDYRTDNRLPVTRSLPPWSATERKRSLRNIAHSTGYVPFLFLLILHLFFASVSASSRLRFITPQRDEFVLRDEFIVVVGVPSRGSCVSKIRLYFDKEDVTKRSRRAAATVSFIPDAVFLARSDLEGPHFLTVVLYGAFGERVEERSILVYIVKDDHLTDEQHAAMIEAGKKIKPVEPLTPFNNGRVVAWFEYETFQDTGHPVAEADAWGNGGIGDFNYDYNVTLRTDENSNYQSLQRFRAAMRYRSLLRLSAGDNWPSYHQAILTQQRVRGLELNLKTPQNIAGLDVVWGRALRPVQPFVINPAAFAACSTHNDSVSAFAAGTYGRTILASRLFVGTPRLLNISATILRATDATSSINQLTLIDTAVNDTAVTGRTPMDNLAYGADVSLNLFRGKAQCYGSFAMSWLTKDISDGGITSEELEQTFGSGTTRLKPENLKWLLILNQSTVPLPLPADSTETINAKSLGGATNWDAGIRLHLPLAGTRNSAEVKYFYTGPHYTSLGNLLLPNDRAGWLIDAETHVFDNRLFFKGRFTRYDKDLFEITGTPTRSIEASLSGFLTPRNDLPTLMLLASIGDERARIDYAGDPDRKNGFSTFGGALHYSHRLGKLTPSTSLSYYHSGTSITTSALAVPFSIHTHTVIAGITSSIDNIPLEPGLTVSLNTTSGDIPLTLMSVAAGTRWHIIPKKAVTDILLTYAHTADPQTDTRNELSLKGSGRYEITRRQSFWADAGLKWIVGTTVDRRIKISYEGRY